MTSHCGRSGVEEFDRWLSLPLSLSLQIKASMLMRSTLFSLAKIRGVVAKRVYIGERQRGVQFWYQGEEKIAIEKSIMVLFLYFMKPT